MSSNAGPDAINDGLILCLDAADPKSYPRSGTAWTDRSGNGYNGTLENSPSFSSNNAGRFALDGVDDYISLEGGLELGSDYTISITVDFTGTQSDWVRLCGHSNNSTYRFWGIWIPAARNYMLLQSYKNVLGTNINISFSNVSFTTDTVYNIVITVADTDVRYYVNGVFYNNSSSWAQLDYTNNSSDITLGYADFHTEHLGNIYNYSMYNRALTDDEVLQNYQATRSRFS